MIGYANRDEADIAVSQMKKWIPYIYEFRVHGGERPVITVLLNRSQAHMDEIDFAEDLERILKKNYVGWENPDIIKGFRKIDTRLSRYTDDEWR